MSISSAVSAGKLRHEVCLCLSKATGIPVAQAQGSVPCLDLTAVPGALISPVHVVRARVGLAVGMASAPTDSTQAHRDRKLPRERKHHPCHAKASSLSSSRGWHGHTGVTRTSAVPEERFSGLCSKVPRETSKSCHGPHPHPILTHGAGLGQLPRLPALLPGCCVRSPALPGGPTPWISPSGCLSGSPAKKRAL